MNKSYFDYKIVIVFKSFFFIFLSTLLIFYSNDSYSRRASPGSPSSTSQANNPETEEELTSPLIKKSPPEIILRPSLPIFLPFVYPELPLSNVDQGNKNADFFLSEKSAKLGNRITYIERFKNVYFIRDNLELLKNNSENLQNNHSILDSTSIEQLIKKNKGEIIIDESIFLENGMPSIDLSGASKIKIVKGKDKKVLSDQNKIETLIRNQPPPILISKIEGCCLYGIPPHLYKSYKTKLRNKKFNKDEVSFISLVKDSATNQEISVSPTLKKTSYFATSKVPETLQDLEVAFKKSNGKTLVVLGHIERGSYTIRNAGNSILFQIPVATMRKMAEKNNVKLIDLGCRTALEIDRDTVGVGVISKFNTVDAIRALEKAISQSKNYSEFFAKLTFQNKGLNIVIDKNFTDNNLIKADIYSSFIEKGKLMWIKIASIFAS